jgi:hypothetical protein
MDSGFFVWVIGIRDKNNAINLFSGIFQEVAFAFPVATFGIIRYFAL